MAVPDRLAVAGSAGAVRGVAVGVGTAQQSVWERHRRWSADGTYAAMFAAVRRHAVRDQVDRAGPDELLSLDATIVRAHQHAAGGRFHQASTLTGGSVDLPESARRTG